MLIILFFISAGLSIAGFFSQNGWWYDLISHFRIQYLFVHIFFLLFFIMIRNKRFILITLFFLLINANQLLPYYLYKPNLEYRNMFMHEKVKILLLNLKAPDKNYTKIMDYIYKVNPDILAMDGVSAEDVSGLNNILIQYQNENHIFSAEGSGMEILSRIPFKNFQFQYYGRSVYPTIISQLTLNEKVFNFILIHLTPPFNEISFAQRNEEFARIAQENLPQEQNTIVIGNFNTGPWSHWFQDFLKKMHLRNCSLGFGIHPTYPTQWPILAVPIDHCLVSKNFSVLNYEQGPDLSLGHYPLVVELGIYQSNDEN